MSKGEFLLKLENERLSTTEKLGKIETEIKAICTMTKEEWAEYKRNKGI